MPKKSVPKTGSKQVPLTEGEVAYAAVAVMRVLGRLGRRPQPEELLAWLLTEQQETDSLADLLQQNHLSLDRILSDMERYL